MDRKRHIRSIAACDTESSALMIGGRRVVALLLSGGGGTRLWPMSANDSPKQFLKLFAGRSLFQRTLDRLADAADIDERIVVANAAHEADLERQTEEVGASVSAFVLEPTRRDSGPAIAAGVAAVLERYPSDTLVIVLPCDHLIPDPQAFLQSLRQCLAVAGRGYLGTFGIRAAHPSTEFGYIERGEALTGQQNAYRVARFLEKPAIARAREYVTSASHYWNSGIFVFRADVFAKEAERWMPEIWQAARASVRAGVKKGRQLLLNADAFARAPKISVDYALFEKSDRVAVVPVSFEWSDVGNWAAIYDALAHDEARNAKVGQAVTRDVSGSVIIGDGVSVIAIGVNDLVIVASPRGTFVAPRSRAAEVKALIDE